MDQQYIMGVAATGLMWHPLLTHFGELGINAKSIVIGGCGRGRSFQYWKRAYPSADVFGVDPCGIAARYKKWDEINVVGDVALVIEWPNPLELDKDPWDATAVATLSKNLTKIIAITGGEAPTSSAFNELVADFKKMEVGKCQILSNSYVWIDVYDVRTDAHESDSE